MYSTMACVCAIALSRRVCTRYNCLQQLIPVFHVPGLSRSHFIRPTCVAHATNTWSIQFSTASSTSDVKEPNRPGKIRSWFGRFYFRKMTLTRTAVLMYQECIDKIDYETFFKVCSLPDTFQSWFLVAHLHLWLCLVRLKREGDDGAFLINQLVQFFWKDVEERMSVLGVHSGKAKTQSLQDFGRQFKGIMLAYEEGLLSSDKKMATAIWRVFVGDKDDTDLVMLATMVEYVRLQVQHMDTISRQSLLELGELKLKPLNCILDR